MDRERIKLIAAAGLFVLIGLVLYLGVFRSPAPGSPATGAPESAAAAPLPAFPFTAADFLSAQDVAVLQDARLNAFLALPELPLTIPSGGRENPFAAIP